MFCISNDLPRKMRPSSPELVLYPDSFQTCYALPGGWKISGEGSIYFQLISDNCQISVSHFKLFSFFITATPCYRYGSSKVTYGMKLKRDLITIGTQEVYTRAATT